MTDSKANSAANLSRPRPVFPPIYEEDVTRVLRWVAHESKVVTVDQLAAEICKAAPTMYHKLQEPDEKLTLAEFCAITRLAVSKGSMDLVNLMLPGNYGVVQLDEPSGSLDEEISELLQDAGRMLTNVKRGKKAKAVADSAEVIQDATAIARTVKGIQ